MGIFKAGMSAIKGAAEDQWKEIFCAGEMGADLLMMRAKRMASERGSNNGNNNVITDGSLIIVGEGEAAIATEGGKIIGVYKEAGEHTFRSTQSEGIFSGLGSFIKDVGNRISFGGDVAISQRLYYINTKELTGGIISAEGVPVRYKDLESGLDIDGGVSCYGKYTFRIADPELFYKAAIRSSNGRYRHELLGQMDSETLTALSPALAKMTEEGVHPSELVKYTEMLCEKLREVMSDKWSGLRGIEVVSVAIESMQVLDAEMIRTMQRDKAFRNPGMAAAHLTGATASAMQSAANNKGGMSPLAAAILGRPTLANDGTWKCRCGVVNKGKFCTECGEKKAENTY